MEAANLGAYLRRPQPDGDARRGAALLAARAVVPAVRRRLGCARRCAVRERFPGGAESLGIPTWHYGHEPPNVFATAIAKYFRNAPREAILLQVCDAGIVFLPGAAGTVQEVFQDACENYYADESSVAPMVLVGARYWTEELPAWPLLQALARGRPMESTCTSSTPSRRPAAVEACRPDAASGTRRPGPRDATAATQLGPVLAVSAPWRRSLRPR